jgi:hypothetical protein
MKYEASVNLLEKNAKLVIEHLQQTSGFGLAKVIGSALSCDKPNDIDVIVSENDPTQIFAELLFWSKAYNVHPIQVSDKDFKNIHNLMAWNCDCVSSDTVSNLLLYGELYADWRTTKELKFNEASLKIFNNYDKSLAGLKKKINRGLKITDLEKFYFESLFDRYDMLNDKISSELSMFLDTYYGDIITSRRSLRGHLSKFKYAIAGGCIRDIILEKPIKDIDIFVVNENEYNKMTDFLATVMEEIIIPESSTKKINLRKFKLIDTNVVLDVIHYGFACKVEHVVETFDFSINMLWYDVKYETVEGSIKYPVKDLLDHLRNKKLIMGDSLWYKASALRALKRWGRFRRDGYIANRDTINKYREYVLHLSKFEKMTFNKTNKADSK